MNFPTEFRENETLINNVMITNVKKSSVYFIGYVCVPLLLVLGLCGNILTIVVMRSSKTFLAMSVSKILIALAISDSLLLTLLPFNKQFIRELIGLDIRSLSDFGCKAFYWAFRTAKMTSSWLVVLISIERFVAIWIPLKAKSINTNRRAYIGIAIVFFTVSIYSALWTFYSDQIENGVCYPNSFANSRDRYTGKFLLFGLTLYCFIPATVLCIINALIIFRIVYSTRRYKGVKRIKYSKEISPKKPTAMLIAVASAFVILVTPITSAYLVSYSKKKNIFESKETWVVILREISQLMEQMNYSINFILYVLLGETFRSRLLTLFGCHKGVQRSTTISGQGSVHYRSNSTSQLSQLNLIDRQTSCRRFSEYEIQTTRLVGTI